MNPLTDILNRPELLRFVQLGGLIVARLVPLVTLTPLFGGQAVSPRFRLSAALAFAGCLACALHTPTGPVLGGGVYFLFVLKELLVGTTIALIVLIAFQAFAAAGAFVDLLRGDQALTTFDPHIQRQETALATFFPKLAVVLFFTLGGQRFFFEALGQSFVLIPPEAPLPPRFNGAAIALPVIELVGQLFVLAVSLAGPVIAVTLLTDVSLALISRVAQRIDVTAMGFTIKGTLVVVMLFLSARLLVERFAQELRQMLCVLRGLFGGPA